MEDKIKISPQSKHGFDEEKSPFLEIVERGI
jgi:hypothetical protein